MTASPQTPSASIADAVDATALAQSCFNDLGDLFKAIQDLAPAGSSLHALARIGYYLADDWASLQDQRSQAFLNLRGAA
jgi:hypothetical protein